jgi:type I restriction enzyme R subunit
VDINEFMKDVETLLDSSVATDGYLIGTGEDADDHIKDLSQIDFDALKSRFEKGKKNTELERLKAAIDRSLSKMVEENKSRTDFKERFEQLIADYNAGSLNVDILFDELVNFTQDLNEEAERHIKENLSEEELAIFDILTRPDMQLAEKEADDIKQVCRDLLNRLRAEKLVLDWKKKQNTVADVEVTIGKVLDSGLSEKFEKEVYDEKCRLIFSHVYDCYMGEGKTIYETFASTS